MPVMQSHISWCDSTWNPMTGCTKVSPGCDNCYAEAMSKRMWGGRAFTDIRVHPERLDQVRKFKPIEEADGSLRPRLVFVNSMSDIFHEDVPDAFRDPVFDAGDRLGYVHIGENHRGYLGQGHIDFPQLFGALAERGYEGVITFESFSSAVVDENLTTILRIWRDMWTNGMDLAVQARRYIGEQIAVAAAANS